jgi:beta-1,4-mannosyl-glycoprotein beta-1,4-N-acetylglucosaminyltransferase
MKEMQNDDKKHSRIIDGIIFFNELDLLEIRLNFLNNYIDYFVIVESKKTFQGDNKPLYYSENKARFKSFNSKIIHVVLDDFPEKSNAWKNEGLQRDYMLKGLQHFSDEDYILISDLDEIPNLESLPAKLEDNFFYIFEQSLNYYYLNNSCIQVPNSYGSILTKYKNIKGSIQEIRDLLFKVQNEISSGKNIEFVKNGGWHFSYLASPENIAIKIQSFSHTEFNNEKYMNKCQHVSDKTNVPKVKPSNQQHDLYRLYQINKPFINSATESVRIELAKSIGIVPTVRPTR